MDSARRAGVVLDGVDGFQVPFSVTGDEDREPGVPRQGWQHAAASCIESDFRAATLMPRMNPVERTLLRSQSGPFIVCFSSAASVSPFPCLSASVGVASHLTPLAITAQHVPGQGLWGGEGFHWRVQSLGSAGKQEAELSPTCW